MIVLLPALLVLLGYRPGGPVDLLVGCAAALTLPIALAGLAWPPVARGPHVFAALVWLGLGAGLLLVPSIGNLVAQLLARGRQVGPGLGGAERVRLDAVLPLGADRKSVV